MINILINALYFFQSLYLNKTSVLHVFATVNPNKKIQELFQIYYTGSIMFCEDNVEKIFRPSWLDAAGTANRI